MITTLDEKTHRVREAKMRGLFPLAPLPRSLIGRFHQARGEGVNTVSDFLADFVRAAAERGQIDPRWWPQVARWTGELTHVAPKVADKPSDMAAGLQNFLHELDRADTHPFAATSACDAAIVVLRQVIERAGLAERPFIYNLGSSVTHTVLEHPPVSAQSAD